MHRNEEGSILVFAAIMAVILMGMAAALIQNSATEGLAVNDSFDAAVSFATAEASLELAVRTMDVTDVTTAFLGISRDVSDVPLWNPDPPSLGGDDLNENGWPDFGEPNTDPLVMGNGRIITYAKSEVDPVDADVSYTTVRAIGLCDSHARYENGGIATLLETIIRIEESIMVLEDIVPGAMAVVCGADEEGDYDGDVTISLGNRTDISGIDHDEDGNELGTGAGVAGLAITGGGNPQWLRDADRGVIDGVGPFIDGYNINNDADWTGQQLNAIVQAAISSPDIYVAPGDTWNWNTDGDIGAEDDYQVVHIDISTSNVTGLDGSGPFTGYGLLIITAEGAHTQQLLDLTGQSQWNGLIIIQTSNNFAMTGNRNAINMGGGGATPHMILGGAVFMTEDGADIDQVQNPHSLIDLAGNVAVHYSSATISSAVAAAGLNNIQYDVLRLFAYYRVQ